MTSTTGDSADALHDSVRASLRLVNDEIAAACTRAGRTRGSVVLVAVSKGQPSSSLRAAYAAGQRHFGESYAAEWQKKQEDLKDLDDVVWHFVGRVQRGNARQIARARLVHGVGSTSQAEALHKEGIKNAARLPVLLQVNLAGEDSKNGFSAAELEAALPHLTALDGLEPCGLMNLPPDVDDVAETARAFGAVSALRARVCPGLPELSMGMSGDFGVAIEQGATLVRVGTRIFGARRERHEGTA